MILQHYLQCVPAFGYLRISAHLQLPAAFRSLSRPSSAPSAKASTLRSSSLNRIRLRLLVNTNLRKNHLFRFLLPQQKYLVNCVLLFFDIFSSILSFKKILFYTMQLSMNMVGSKSFLVLLTQQKRKE